ncbi:hypothetical protein BT63DRAFT_135950 [Microthyrium microscopicum]|uniref:Mitochondrial F1F0 ATP synthase subunit Atp14 n=1 Tax=Microthyrium microscopicum TaxID=703497 RepID=A0A6A6UMN1_9PEZI|nr:hypothetical protein BT63DRAFT_135950 [Microthyrium microscopicum]
MAARYTQAIRPIIANITRQSVTITTRRTLFAPSAVRSADLVQQMYLKELQGYKPTPLKANDSEGHVQKFALPKAPTSPEESNISSELSAYESQQPDIEGNAADGAPAAEENWFVEDEEEPAAAH